MTKHRKGIQMINESNEVMTKAIVAFIEASTLPAADKARITAACRSRRRLLNRRQVLERLQVSRPTLLTIIRRGELTEIRITPRKVRFIEAEVEALEAGYGVHAEGVQQ